MNPLFNQMQGQRGQQGGMDRDIFGLLEQFNEFRRTFTGDPEAEIQKIVQSGAISQQDLNRVQKMANALSQFIK